MSAQMQPGLASAIDDAASTLNGIAAMMSFLIESTINQPKLNDALCTIERMAADESTKLDEAAQGENELLSAQVVFPAKPTPANSTPVRGEFAAALAKVRDLNRELDATAGDDQPEIDRLADERSDAITALVCTPAREIAHIRAKLQWMWQDGGSYTVEDDLYRPQIMADLTRLERF